MSTNHHDHEHGSHNHEQCPSSKKAGLPVKTPRKVLPEQIGTTGMNYSRGLDDVADTPEFREFVEREFPAGASELLESERRTFLKLMGAGLALAGATTLPGCRRPDHKILPYSKSVPEDVIPGRPLFFATSMPLPGGGCEGLLVETHEGRPTKIEGNPLHPNNQGKSSAWAQASVLDMYDPDRLKEPVMLREGAVSPEVSVTWDDFVAWSGRHFAQFAGNGGEGLAFICDRVSSPSFQAQRAAVAAKWPKAMWACYDALENRSAAEGIALALGKPATELLSIDKAERIVSLDRDFLQHEAASLTSARQWAHTRRVLSVAKDAAGQPVTTTSAGRMSRMYVAESMFTITGAAADHRLRLSPQQVSSMAVRLAKFVLLKTNANAALVAALDKINLPADPAVDAAEIESIGKDLIDPEFKGKSLLVAGASQPAWVHALCVAVNAAVGNIGKTVSYVPTPAGLQGDGLADLAAVTKALIDGKINTVVTLNANPLFNAPAELRFNEAFFKAAHRITLSVDDNETVQASTWRLNGAHYLEAWGDCQSIDGTISPIQPMIAPLYGGRSAIETLAIILGQQQTAGYDIVRNTWKSVVKGDFERAWRRALHDGVLASERPAPEAPAPAFPAIAQAVASATLAAAPSKDAMHLALIASPMHDGRFLNNAWLNELSEPASKIVWDNAAYLSPRTAKELGVTQTPATRKKPAGRMIDVTVDGRRLRVVAWALPGIPDNTVVIPMGYGRRRVGLVGTGVGFDAFAIRTTAARWSADKAAVAPNSDGETMYQISTTQGHWYMEGRALIREADTRHWAKFGEKFLTEPDTYGRDRKLSFAEQLEGSEAMHMPSNVPVMMHPYKDPEERKNSKWGGRQTPKPAFEMKPQWGMSIDLSTCIGCNVCTVACQAENNIPVVGKVEVNKGREMHWIRVDRYFKFKKAKSPSDEYSVESTSDPVGMIFQPVACVHCENAPCEVVCPVNATVHGPEGHNYMVYNRCIGTRYCANNCPYKVRRFNFFDYGVTKFNGDYFGREAIESVVPDFLASSPNSARKVNPNLIPPRVREKLDQISKMQKNPNVTVRSRGVMEKCSYCIQRTNEAKIELKIKGFRDNEGGIPDGFVQTACQQACPTNSIVFGDILDTDNQYTLSDGSKRTGSMVNYWRNHGRSYLLLGYLATAARTTYAARINNHNTELAEVPETPFGDHHPGSPDQSGHGGSASLDGRPFVDPTKTGRDGYVMSLSVLGVQA